MTLTRAQRFLSANQQTNNQLSCQFSEFPPEFLVHPSWPHNALYQRPVPKKWSTKNWKKCSCTNYVLSTYTKTLY